MTLYHGSHYQFNQFDISRCKETSLEGYGIYFTPYLDVAKSYGNIIYQVDVANITDLSNLDNIQSLVSTILQQWYGQDTHYFPYFEEYTEGLYYGDYSFSQMQKDLFNYLCESIEVFDYTELNNALAQTINYYMPVNYLYKDSTLDYVVLARETQDITINDVLYY